MFISISQNHIDVLSPMLSLDIISSSHFIASATIISSIEHPPFNSGGIQFVTRLESEESISFKKRPLRFMPSIYLFSSILRVYINLVLCSLYRSQVYLFD